MKYINILLCGLTISLIGMQQTPPRKNHTPPLPPKKSYVFITYRINEQGETGQVGGVVEKYNPQSPDTIVIQYRNTAMRTPCLLCIPLRSITNIKMVNLSNLE